MNLQGASELRNRLEATTRANRGYPRDWGDTYVQVARPQIPQVTGKARASVNLSHATDDGAEIEASSAALWIDTGTGRHGIEPSRRDVLVFPKAGRTIFARKVDHPGQRAKPWRERSLLEAVRRNPLAERVINAWNRAA